LFMFFFFSSRRRHTRSLRDWSSDVCSSDLEAAGAVGVLALPDAHASLPEQRRLLIPGDAGDRDASRQARNIVGAAELAARGHHEIGRASCRERGERPEGDGVSKEKAREGKK